MLVRRSTARARGSLEVEIFTSSGMASVSPLSIAPPLGDYQRMVDDEGCFRLQRLPTPADAVVIRDVLVIRKRAVLVPAEREQRRAIGKRLARGAGRPN